MRKVEFGEQLTMRLSKEERAIVERLADQKEMSLGEAARYLLDCGIEAAGISTDSAQHRTGRRRGRPPWGALRMAEEQTPKRRRSMEKSPLWQAGISWDELNARSNPKKLAEVRRTQEQQLAAELEQRNERRKNTMSGWYPRQESYAQAKTSAPAAQKSTAPNTGDAQADTAPKTGDAPAGDLPGTAAQACVSPDCERLTPNLPRRIGADGLYLVERRDPEDEQ